eukprot:10048133-Alexandrium_andersonii.AAC.1
MMLSGGGSVESVGEYLSTDGGAGRRRSSSDQVSPARRLARLALAQPVKVEPLEPSESGFGFSRPLASQSK